MAASQPFSVALQGGLDKSSNSLELLQTPGKATRLKNFEVSTKGGYRRINGYTQLGDGTRPNSSNEILGMHVYADGVLASSGTNIYFSQDGNSWLQINKASVAGGGDNYSTFTGRSASARTSQSKTHFATFEGNTIYGEVIITDEGSGVKPFYFKMTGTDSDITNRTFFAKEITVSGTHFPKYCVIHDKHLVVAGAATALNTIFYSGTSDIDDFTSTGSGSIVLDDQVVGLKSFRDELFIFCKNSIYKLQNINNSSTIAIVPVTKNVGCVDGKTIQEFAGDLIFLAPDGFRTIAGTARIGDVELGTISKSIQPLINDIFSSTITSEYSSVVLRDKSQYRMYYSASNASTTNSKGIIGTLTARGFEWAEVQGIQAPAVASGFNYSGKEKIYHGDRDGYIYNHDTGNSFNPAGTETNVEAEYQSPDFDYGDFGTLKTLDHIKVSVFPEGSVEPTLRVRFDYDSTDRLQPTDVGIISATPSIFGDSSAVFGTSTFGAPEQPLVRATLTGSGHSNFFKIFSNDTNAPYTVNGLYVNYRPSGRQ
tara:strand:- start:175 stop:1791 length:1617 start_codon:yes stop_codon:yes gene_type:complete